MAALDAVRTVVIVMLENRSFDHMLGYLSLLEPKMAVDGLVPAPENNSDYRQPLAKLLNDAYLNVSSGDGELHYPFHMADNPLTIDLPHDRHSVETQLGRRNSSGYLMEGFVDAYYNNCSTRMELVDPMGFFTAAEVPMMDFFARNFTLCERWFAPLPADTQPNRLMAFSGETVIDRDLTLIPPTQPLVFEWLETNGIDWCVYSDDLPFFTLLPKLWPKILHSKLFRKFSTLTADVVKVSASSPFPKVVFIEPSFLDSPFHPDHDPNDDHPILPVGFGEDFLRQVYQALTSPQNLTLWKQMVMIVTFDEHGGFYDHVSPLFPVSADCGTGNSLFQSTGARVPAFVVSPFASARQVYPHNLDHTSMLEFLAEWLTPGTAYSPAVTNRLAQSGFNMGRGRGKLSDVLDLLSNPRPEPPNEPTGVIRAVRSMPGKKTARTPNEMAFERAAREMLQQYPAQVAEKYPALLHWQQNS